MSRETISKWNSRKTKLGENEWMWVRVDHADDVERIVFGRLDSEPVVNKDLRLGMELAVSYDNVCEHRKSAVFGQ